IMRRRTDPQTIGKDHANGDQKERHQTLEVQGRVSYGSWIINIGKCLVLIFLVPPFLNYASLQREGQMLLPKDGQIIDVGLGQKMHLLCKGHGIPVVILDAPTGMSSDVWFHVQEDVASITKVCTYDRMGLGFSRRLMPNETTGTERTWGLSTTGRMVDDLHRLLQAAEIATPFILVGSELGAFNARFYSHIHDVQVSNLVLIDPIPEDIFEEDLWKEYWYGKLLPSLQAKQFSAATGLSRMLIILGAIEPTVRGQNMSEEVIQRQKYLLCNPGHQSSAVDEHYFLNESASQVKTSVSVITGDHFDREIPEQLNELQKKFLEESYPSANHIHIKGTDRRMIYKQPSAITQHLRKLINQRQAKRYSA
uniref:Si:dkey-122a22.2 n=1 Tax=Neogobius melanostomus TaxID=47308 RepID=A0A8C6TS94_9GOBI